MIVRMTVMLIDDCHDDCHADCHGDCQDDCHADCHDDCHADIIWERSDSSEAKSKVTCRGH